MPTNWIDIMEEDRDSYKEEKERLEGKLEKIQKLLWALEEPEPLPEDFHAQDRYGHGEDCFEGGLYRGSMQGQYNLGQKILKMIEE